MSAQATTFCLSTHIKAIKNKSHNPALIPLPKERTHVLTDGCCEQMPPSCPQVLKCGAFKHHMPFIVQLLLLEQCTKQCICKCVSIQIELFDPAG